MPRAVTLTQRTREGMDGRSLAMRELVTVKRFDPNVNPFMQVAKLAGVVVADTERDVLEQRADVDKKPATAEVVRKPAGEMATRAAATLDTEVPEELIAEINASTEEEPSKV